MRVDISLTNSNAHERNPRPFAQFDTINPATGAIIAAVRATSFAEIDTKVAEAKEAQRAWAKTTPEHRASVLREVARGIRNRASDIACLEVADNGRTLTEITTIDVETSAQAFEFYAGAILALEGHHRDYPNGFAYFRREPIGVCGGIGAWNYPFQIASWKTAPALAAGNAMIFKPSELTPLSVGLLQEVLLAAGVPEMLFQVIQGSGQVGAHLCSHRHISMVTMTGSIATGRKVLHALADGIKPAVLELGGKSPLIITEDCDIEDAANVAVTGNFFSNGEICSNTTRVYVHRKIVKGFEAAVAEKTARIRTGNPMTAGVHNGALISLAHRNKVHAFVEEAQNDGANLLIGGAFAEVDELPLGAFYQPTVLTNCRDDMLCVREEIFGPVMTVLSYNDEQEVISRANATDAGLAAAIVCRDVGRAHRMARELDAGTVWINTALDLPTGFTAGGFKQSGIGYENGLEALKAFTRLKGVYTALSSPVNPFA